MKKIMKWLDQNGIQYNYTEQYRNKYITIILERDCIWINGFGEPMKYNKTITISYDTYRTYSVYEKTGYSLSKKLGISKKADIIIKILTDRLK